MTAELFVKLAAQLSSKYQERPSDDYESGSSHPDQFFSATEEYLKEHRDSDGGVKIKLGGNLTGLDIDSDSKVKTRQWLPRMSSKFWDKYINKLRVSATEVGVCDLAERDEDGDVEIVRRQLGQL